MNRRATKRRAMAAMAALAAALLVPGAGRADNSCANQTHQNNCSNSWNPFPCCAWSGLEGNCTWWAWEKACRVWNEDIPPRSNAEFWDTQARDGGYHVSGEPCAETVFVCESNTTECLSGDVGHVGWVTEVFPDGAVEVSEMGCYWFHDIRDRRFNAQNASPPMNYIYEQGTTSCVECECDPGITDVRDCTMCATDTRTCGSDCMWGPWSGCVGGGVCTEGTEQPCGQCGTQFCDAACQWGVCEDPCAGQEPDADLPVTPDGGPATGSDAAGPDAGGIAANPWVKGVQGGCTCRWAPGESRPAWFLLALLLLSAGLVIRRRWF